MSILRWLDRSDTPADVYTLLGVRRLEPDAALLQATLRAAYREVLQAQRQAVGAKVDRLQWLQGALGRAEATCSDPAALAQQDRDLLRDWGRAWSQRRREQASLTTRDLERWLLDDEQLHPDRLAEVVEKLEGSLDATAAWAAPPRRAPQAEATPPRMSPTVPPELAELESVLPTQSSGRGAMPARMANPAPRPSPVRTSNPRVALPAWTAHWRWYAGVAGVILLLLVANLWVLSLRQRPGRNEVLTETQTPAPGELAEPEVNPTPPPHLTPSTPSLPPAAVAPLSPANLPRVAPPAVASRPIELTGTFEKFIWNVPPNESFRLFVSVDAPVSGYEVFDCQLVDMQFMNGLLDYRSTEDVEELPNAPADARGDRVRVTGRLSGEEPTIRFDGKPAARVTIETIEVVDRPVSRVVVGGPLRSPATFVGTREELNLLRLVRYRSEPDATWEIAGTIRRAFPEHQALLVAWGTSDDRGVEIEFPEWQSWPIGTRVRVSGPYDGLRPRVQGQFASIRCTLKVEQIARLDDPAMPTPSASPSVPPAVPSPTALTPPARMPTPASPAAAPTSPPPDQSTASTGAPPSTGAAPRVGKSAPNEKGRGEVPFIVAETGKLAAFYHDGKWWQFSSDRLTPSDIFAACVDRQEQLWLAGVGGITQIGGSTRSFTVREGMPTARITQLAEDSRGALWFTSQGGGAGRLRDGSWQRFSTTDGLHSDQLNGLAEGAGRLWIAGGSPGSASRDQGVSTWLDERFEPMGPAQGLQAPWIAVDGDRTGRVVLAHPQGLLIVHPELRVEQLGANSGLPARDVSTIFCDSQGRLWVGTFGGGAVQVSLAGAQVLKQFELSRPLHVRGFAEDRAGRIWLTSLEGTWRLDAQGWQPQTIPKSIAKGRQIVLVPRELGAALIAWGQARALADKDLAPAESFDVDPATARPRSPIKQTTLTTAAGASTTVFINATKRAFLLDKLGAPQVVLTIPIGSRNRTAELYAGRPQGQIVSLVFVAYDEQEVVEYIDLKRIPLMTTQADQQNAIDQLIDGYQKSFQKQP